MYNSADLETRFTYHPPKEGQPEIYESIRDECKRLAHFISERCPQSPELDQALNRLDETMMWANASIARRE